MRRRAFITLLGGAAAWPLAARAQQPDRIRRIGVLNPFAENDPEVQANITAFRQVLQKLGWTDGRNVRIDYRWGGADPGRIHAQAKELVGLNPDVILVSSALALQPLMHETRSIPIVFTQIADPIGAGLVASLARPGGNITGFTVAEFSTFGKLLEVLKEVAPHVTRVAVVLNPDQIPQTGMLRAIEAAAPSFRVQVTAAGARDATELERAIDQFARVPNGGLIVLPNPVTDGNRGLIIAMVPGTAYLRLTPSGTLSRTAAWSPTGSIWPISSGKRPLTSIASCAARSPPTFRSSSRPSTRRCSTSRPPRGSASMCLGFSSSAPTR